MAALFLVAWLASPVAAAPSLALQFDGANYHVTFGAAPGLSQSNFTLEVWFKRTGAGVSTGTGGGGIADAIPLIDKGRSEGDGSNLDMNYVLAIRASDNRLVADFEEGASGTSPGLNHPVAGNTAITNNGWYHAAATYDGATWRLYLNGALEANLFVGQPPRWDSIQHAALATAMNSSGVASGFFQGVLDEARIWNYARSASEISNDYRRQIVSAPGLVGRWALDDGAGTVATNTSSGGVNGTLVNGPVWVAGYPFEVAPTVSITNPPTGTNFTAPTYVLVEVAAADLDGSVTNVAFLANGTPLGEVTNAPFALTWSNAPVGRHTLIAVATDDIGLSSTSAPVSITVHDPVVRLTAPTNGASFITPVDVSLAAAVTPTNDLVALVEFFAGVNKLGEVAAAPWAFTWSNAPPGAFALTAVATESGGILHTSAPVNVTLATNNPPSVSLTAPTNNANFRGPTNIGLTATASDSDGSVTNVEFFAGGNKLGEDAASPFSLAWSNAPLGNYALAAVATDDRGLATTSAIVNISITTNAPPSVALTSPADGASFASGANVTLTASASDDLAVSKVEFFIGGEKFRTDTNAPHSVVWSNAALGLWTLTAVATDNEGFATTSAPVYVTLTNSAGGTNTIVSQGMSWRYLDNGSDQGTAWRAAGFDDIAWAVGAAQLGYGDGDEITVVGFGGNPSTRYITTYFRKPFEVLNPALHAQLSLRLLRDDGAVVYLNGNEIFRSNMPGGVITNGTLASSSVSGSAESAFLTALVDATNLVTGANVLAVEVHQSAPDSSDISFDLQLLGTATAAGVTLTRGPYLQMGTTNSVIVRWRTEPAGDSVVRFGTNAATLDQTITDSTATTEHIVTVTNLAAATKYFYAIATGTNTLASGTNHFFVTSPPVGVARPTRLWVLGDSGTANANAQSVRNAYLNLITTNRAADVWLMLGDNAYNSGLDTEYQAAVFDMYPTVLRNTPLWSTIGNHETAQQTTISTFSYLDIFTLPQAGEAGGMASGTERYYSFDYANIHFLCLDAMTSGRTANTPMFDWVRADLAATTQEWIIAFWHHPPYTKGSHNSDAENDLVQIRTNWLPVLESFGVDLVLSGHSHCYERSFLLSGHYGFSSTFTNSMKMDPGDGRTNGAGPYLKSTGTGTVYTVAGNGGQATGGSLNHPAMFRSLNELGSLIIDVNSNRLDLQMLGPSAVRDTFTIVKQPAPTPSFDRYAQQGFKARRAKFLENGYSALTNAGPASAGGGSAAVANDWVFYAPPSGYNAPDSFPFAVTNAFGKSATGIATVNITTDNAPSQNVTVDDLGNGSFRLRCSGIPGRSYSIQFSNDLGAPVWQSLAIGSADAQGVFEHIDTPPGGTRFYRTAQP